jgi:hypothetical protein
MRLISGPCAALMAGARAGPDEWRLTKCLACGVQAHCRLNYTLGNNSIGQKTCRACHWPNWATERRNQPWREFDPILLDLLREHTPEQILEGLPPPTAATVREFLESRWWPPDRIISHLHEHGFIANTVDVNDGNDPVVARCRACKRRSAARMADFGFGCTCSRNTRSSNPARPRLGRALLTESASPALSWWDHERNDEATLATVSLRATRTCHAVCPECGLRFAAKANYVADRPSCPGCAARRQQEAARAVRALEGHASRRRARADVRVGGRAGPPAGDGRRRPAGSAAPLPQGTHPNVDMVRFLQAGCPHCRGAQTALENRRWLADTLAEDRLPEAPDAQRDAHGAKRGV